MISAIDLEQYLPGVELVVAGGESDRFARPMYYDWVLSLREQCVRQNVSFAFRQCGTHFIKDGRPKKFTPEQISLALSLPEQGNAYRQITTMTGISKSTLIRAKQHA